MKTSRPSTSPESQKDFAEIQMKPTSPASSQLDLIIGGKPKLGHMERRKWNCLRRILGQETGIEILNEFFGVLRPLEAQARRFYSDNFHLERMDFMEMMLLDGCFIVDYLCQPLHNIPEARSWMQCQINSDLLLLENQLPFFVLDEIYQLVNNGENLQEVALSFCQHVTKRTGLTVLAPIVFQHLLHFFHAYLFSGERQRGNQPRPFEIRTIHTARVLKKAGIRFIMMDGIDRVLNVRFSDGVMHITPLVIDSFTISQYKNLIAFEKVNPRIEPQFTAFVQFMNYIIDTSEDVMLLREKAIIKHALGSDKEVATVFNQLTTGTFEYITTELATLYTDADGYCNNKINKHKASLMREYWKNPWAVLSTIAVGVLVSLAIYQAVLTSVNYFQHKHSPH